MDSSNGDNFWLALFVGSIVSIWLPESESKIEEKLFGESTYQMSELKLVIDTLVKNSQRSVGNHVATD